MTPSSRAPDSDGAERADDIDRQAPPLKILSRPLFWLLLIGALWSLPLIKGLTAELPEPLPGYDRAPLDLVLSDEAGAQVRLSDLTGYLLLLIDLPMSNGTELEASFRRARELRSRLRGLGSELVNVFVAHGGEAADLSAFVDRNRARKPVNTFLIDVDGAALSALRGLGGRADARFFLLDRHARLRGVYGHQPDDLDALVTHAGQLANWVGSDPEPGQPVRE